MKRTTFLWMMLPALLWGSCSSPKQVRRDMDGNKGSLYYELTSMQYEGPVYDTIYMDFIDFSNMDYYTAVKRRGGYVVPLLLFNTQRTNFRTVLGEYSLTQTFREFLTDAMLAECNSSTRIALIDNKDGDFDASGGYRLRLKVEENETRGRLSHSGFLLLLPSMDDELEGEGGKVHPASTRLRVRATLTCRGDTLLDKSYQADHRQPKRRRTFGDTHDVNLACLDDMAQSLSLATKKLVENICQELDMLIEGRSLNAR